jgi:hypothetical protein
MKTPFRHKRVRAGKMLVHSIHVNGFTDDTGRKRASIVISAMTGSNSRLSGRESRRLCDALNKAWTDFYEGER